MVWRAAHRGRASGRARREMAQDARGKAPEECVVVFFERDAGWRGIACWHVLRTFQRGIHGLEAGLARGPPEST